MSEELVTAQAKGHGYEGKEDLGLPELHANMPRRQDTLSKAADGTFRYLPSKTLGTGEGGMWEPGERKPLS